MTLPASGTIAMSNFNTELGVASTTNRSMSSIYSLTKTGQQSYAMNAYYSKAYYKKTNAGNCNNGNCNVPGNCTYQCTNCTTGGAINCANCDAQSYIQTNCNCACTYNCTAVANVLYDCACACSTDSGGSSCFLEGSLILMADGTTKEIQDVAVGDYVVGAFGERNQIIAKDIVTLGNRWMYSINGEHETSGEHPHVSPERQFYSIDVGDIYKEWGQRFECELADGSLELWTNVGLTKTKVKPLEIGLTLIKDTGPRIVETIEPYRLPPETRLYNFVVGGSHTYFVDGYAVTGWPREDDFDYAEWKPTGKILTVDDYRNPTGE